MQIKMEVSLFIKTYKNDFVWLKYCLESIAKYCTGYSEVVIVCPRSDVPELLTFATHGETIYPVDEKGDGYLYQQLIKMNADEYCKSEWIQYFDSDCIFHSPNSPDMYFEQGKPVMLKTPYSVIGEDARVWQKVVAKALGFVPEYEYMRRHGLIYHRETLRHIHEKFPKMNDHIMSRPLRHFSEFNVMGAFVEVFERDRYIWKNTEETPFKAGTFHQFWSYSGCTEEEKERMNKMINP
jgi:glycosyltransferase involved in cell wall biosynthesis